MNPVIESYMDDIEMLFVHSPVVSRYSIRERDVRGREGYIRIRAQLSNRDIFEAFEFVTAVKRFPIMFMLERQERFNHRKQCLFKKR